MIIPLNGPGRMAGAQVQRLRHVDMVCETTRLGGVDRLSISRFAELVECARAAAMSLPDVRPERIDAVRAEAASGPKRRPEDIASAMINRAVEGQV